MTRYLLDTNHAGLALRRSIDVLQELQSKLSADDRMYLSTPTVAELWYMVFKSDQVVANKGRLERLLGALDHAEFDLAAAEEFGRIHAALRKLGQPIPVADMQIAAVALTKGLVLATADAHFARIPGLVTVNLLL